MCDVRVSPVRCVDWICTGCVVMTCCDYKILVRKNGVVLPWHVCCAVPGCVLTGTMIMSALYVLAEPMVVPARLEIA